ncbi:MAG: hypothetical protein AB9856_20755 [Cellulosilyticaceae bacterium]
MVSNKKKGSGFEEEFAQLLSENRFWAHVIAPNPKDGSQPFDVVAAKNESMYAFDCKTVEGDRFPLNRIEENQEKAFQRLGQCGSYKNYFAFKVKENVYLCEASALISFKKTGCKSISVLEMTTSFEEWVRNA